MGLFTGNPIDEAIEKATSECLPNAQEDLAASLEVCDIIRGKRVDAKTAMRSLKQRLVHRNPNVQMLAIKLTDACFKNTGQHFLQELASREFADTIASMARSQDTSNPVTKMAVEYLQIWALICKDDNGMGYLYEVYQELLRAGTRFPPAPKNFNKAVTKTLAPPEWIDANQCTRCRVPFSLTLRKHHCRHCGNVFCQDCSSKTMSLPEMGIPDPVRICEPCYVKKTESKYRYQKSAPLPATPPQLDNHDHGDEDDELSLAIKLSLQESQKPSRSASQTLSSRSSVPIPSHEDEEEKMIKAAIEASLKETNSKTPAVEPHQIVSDLDKENAKLFSQLVDKLSLSGPMNIEPEIEALSISMQVLRDNVKRHISESRNVSQELAGILATLEISLAKYQLLKQMPVVKPEIHHQPSYPETHAPPAGYHTLPPAPQHYPQAPYPVYGMPSYPSQQVPSAPVYTQPQPAPQEGQLLDEEPLIKL